ncbi:MAG: hypothetical protein M3Q89_00865 [Verrucomicrobiota bacterium]|nr:hypothetical protein [Verrucomicrobiota bacterium]
MKQAKQARRQIFVLTPEEKKAVACVLAAFVLGLGTKHYRSTHPRPPPPPTAREERVAKIAARSAAARARSARGGSPAATPPVSPLTTPAIVDEIDDE